MSTPAVAAALAIALASGGAAASPDQSQTAPPTIYVAPIKSSMAEPDDALVRSADRKLLESLSPRSVASPDDASACSEPTCWAAAADEHGASYLVTTEIADAGPDKRVTLVLTELPTQTVVVSLGAPCELCGRDELVDLVGDLSAKIGRRIDALEVATTKLRVASDPAGAGVWVDGERVGETPYEDAVDFGAHEIRVELDGYVSTTRSLDIARGSVSDLQVLLAPSPAAAGLGQTSDDPSRASPSERRMVVGGSVALAVGVAALGAGVAMLVLHAKPIERDCGGENVDPDGDCRFLHDTRAPGVAFVVTGGVAAIAGAVVLGVGLSRRTARTKRASIRPGAAGVHVRF